MEKISIPTKTTFYTLILDEHNEIISMTLFKTLEAASYHYEDIVENYGLHILNASSVSYGKLDCHDIYKKEVKK